MFNKFYWSRYSSEFLNVDQIRKFTKRLSEKKLRKNPRVVKSNALLFLTSRELIIYCQRLQIFMKKICYPLAINDSRELGLCCLLNEPALGQQTRLPGKGLEGLGLTRLVLTGRPATAFLPLLPGRRPRAPVPGRHGTGDCAGSTS